MGQKLTDRQEIFCEEYIKDFNGSRAARAAGYSVDSVRTTASDTLAKQYIKDHIANLMADRSERLKVDATKIVEELAKIGLSSDSSDLAGGFSIEMKDKIKALELLGRHTGAFNEDESSKSVITVNIAKDSE